MLTSLGSRENLAVAKTKHPKCSVILTGSRIARCGVQVAVWSDLARARCVS